MSVCAMSPLLKGAWSPSSMRGMSCGSGTVSLPVRAAPRAPAAVSARAAKRSTASAARRSTVAARSPSSATGSLSQKTSSRPAAAAPSATTSTAAAFILGEEHVRLRGGARHSLR